MWMLNIQMRIFNPNSDHQRENHITMLQRIKQRLILPPVFAKHSTQATLPI